MTFYVGQKVVSLRSDWPGGYGDEIDPVAGVVYTIRAIVPYPDDGPTGLLLEEIVNVPREYEEGFYECDFKSQCFRPLVEDRKSVSFTAGAPKDSEQWDNRRKVHERA